MEEIIAINSLDRILENLNNVLDEQSELIEKAKGQVAILRANQEKDLMKLAKLLEQNTLAENGDDESI